MFSYLVLTFLTISMVFADLPYRSFYSTQYYSTPTPEFQNCKKREASSLTYLVDTTGSMSDDLYQLNLVNSWLLNRVVAQFPCGVRQYTMVQFNDPTVGPVQITNSTTEFDYFFSKLNAYGGDDCPELAVQGLELALENSPPNSFILVLTDASAKDYRNTTLVEKIRNLIKSKNAQVYFLITGLCSGLDDPAFLIYRELASLSFGHVFQVDLKDLNKVFNYLDFTLSRPVNSSRQLFSGNYTSSNHSNSFAVGDNFTELVVTTDGTVYSVRLTGPGSVEVAMKKIISELWGSMYVLRNPAKGVWTMYIYANGAHSVNVEGFVASNISSTTHCSDCHANATCDKFTDSYICSCKDGFIGDGFTCSDIDECAYSWSNNCSSGMCKNTFGSFICNCSSGYYRASETSCIDINECSNPELNKCDPSAACYNYPGTYSCVCPPGISGNGFFCDTGLCPTGLCGFGMECLSYNSSCYDPCLNHTILNEPWRSSSNAYYSYPNCDNDKFGWYRFVGSGGVRIPETCVPEIRCGTHAPMWINGSHPVLSDGIVTRSSCAHWSGNCCLWSTKVKIKACPNGYHVYKFTGTPACSLTYCTDPDTSSVPCATDEDLILKDGVYGCYCKVKYAISDIADFHPVLTCGARDMRASFQKCQLKALNINNIKDIGCLDVWNDNTTSTYSIISPLKAGKCGTQVIKNSTHAVYKNNLFLTMDIGSGIITRTEEVNILMSCTYKIDMLISLNLALQPAVGSTNISLGGTGQFSVYIALYKDSAYTLPYEGSRVVVSIKTILYIGIFTDGGDPSQDVLVMKNCYATPTENADDPVKYYIIQNSCPNRQDSTIEVTVNGVSKEARFSVQMFKFVGGYSQVYLHCQISLCDVTVGSCIPSCSGLRSLTDTDTTTSYNLKVGPVVLEDPLPTSITGKYASVVFLPAFILLAKFL
ncbi:uromodulin-like [Pelobates fuscus]|uniref:uromodulin-like n=1 Tax=Pelobates fuscus TaxID=191477 RepID=UPI002FE49C74